MNNEQRKMIRLSGTDMANLEEDEKRTLGVIDSKAPLMKKADDEQSLTSASTAPSDPEFIGDPSNIGQNYVEEEHLKVENSDNRENLKAPALADLSFSTEGEETQPVLQKHLSTIDDNVDNNSQASVSTLLSDLSSVDEKHVLDRLEDDFELRDILIKTLVVEKDQEHLKIVREYEELMRKALRDHYEQQAKRESTGRLTHEKQSKSTQPTFAQRVNDSLILNESVRGCASIILYCVAHLSCWEITTAMLYELTQNYENQCLVHTTFLLTSLAMLRISGGIFGWLDANTYVEAQTALHGRSGSLDARVIKWFRRRPNLKATVNMLAFYICWTAVAYFQSIALHLFDKRESLKQGLPSYHHDHILTSVKDKLVYGLDYGEEAMEFEARDYAYLVKELSISSIERFMGDDYASLVSTKATMLFFTTAAVLSIAFLRFMLGHTFEV